MNNLPVINYTFQFEFERNFDVWYYSKWMRNNSILPFVTISTYLAVIFILKAYMKTRTALDLRKPLILWNILLAVFSTLGSLRLIPVLFFELNVFGFHHSLCDSSFMFLQNTGLFWGWIFAMSKYIELGDTFFVVLKKRELLFIHWYHHVTVLLATWFGFGDLSAPVVWTATMNYTVHTIMYTYYALRALRVKTPRFVAMSITTLQILQMIVGLYLYLYIYFIKATARSCDVSDRMTTIFLLMYSSYFLLFVNYFFRSYLIPTQKKKLQ